MGKLIRNVLIAFALTIFLLLGGYLPPTFLVILLSVLIAALVGLLTFHSTRIQDLEDRILDLELDMQKQKGSQQR